MFFRKLLLGILFIGCSQSIVCQPLFTITQRFKKVTAKIKRGALTVYGSVVGDDAYATTNQIMAMRFVLITAGLIATGATISGYKIYTMRKKIKGMGIEFEKECCICGEEESSSRKLNIIPCSAIEQSNVSTLHPSVLCNKCLDEIKKDINTNKCPMCRAYLSNEVAAAIKKVFSK